MSLTPPGLPHSQPRLLVVSSGPGHKIAAPTGLEVGGLPRRLALRDLLQGLFDDVAAAGGPPPMAVDTLHIPYQESVYGTELLAHVAFAHRYDVVLPHIVLDNGARVAESFLTALGECALEPHGELWNPVRCIRKTTLHEKAGPAADSAEPMPCIIKLDQNHNRKESVRLCRTEADVDAWKRETPAVQQQLFVREPFHVDHQHRAGGVYRLERWQIAFDSLTVETRLSDDLFVKASTSFRFQVRDRRRLETDWQLLGRFGWHWRGQSVDCGYDEDERAWDARYLVMRQATAGFALHFGELDVIRTGHNEFTVIDVTNTPGIVMGSRYCLRLTQAILLQRLCDVASGTPVGPLLGDSVNH